MVQGLNFFTFKGGETINTRATTESNPLRKKIFLLIWDRPGIHHREILRTLGITNGALVQHLYILEREGDIRAKLKGHRKHYFIAGIFDDKDRRHLLGPTQKKIYSLITKEEGIYQKDIANRLGMSRANICYHIKEIKGLGLIQDKKEGKHKRYFSTEG